MGEKSLEYYKRLPYTRRVRVETEPGGSQYFVAYVEELDGVEADGDTPAEAHYRLQDAFEETIDALLEWGEEIPEPERWPERIGRVGPVPSKEEPGGEDVEELWSRTSSPWQDDMPRWRRVNEEDFAGAGAS